MPKVKLVDAIEKDSIKFNFGEDSIKIDKKGVEAPKEFVENIERDYPGWIEAVPEDTATPVKKKLATDANG